MVAKHHKLDNLIAIVAALNGMQADGRIADVTGIMPIADKWRSFGWQVYEIDGHHTSEIMQALHFAERNKGLPSVLVAITDRATVSRSCKGERTFTT